MSRRNIWIPLALLAVCLLGSGKASAQKTVADCANKVGQTMFYMDKLYLDTVNLYQITDKVIAGIMKELDPHSSYITAKDAKAMNEPLDGNFDGVGVEFAIINDTLTINATVPGGPSEKVGIRSGDKFVKVDGENITGIGLTIPKVHKYLRGPKGSKVELEVIRKGVKEPLEFTVTRDKIPLNSIDAYYMMADGNLYLRLTRFAATSYKEMLDALTAVKQKPSGLILDLRGNPGGYLGAAIQIANEFLEKGQLIVFTEGRTLRRQEQCANGYGILRDVPVAVLVDENSASASEIVSGALQDWDRGTIIGRRTFGKGLVQQQLPLQDGALLRLTVARYHTPCGRVIQSPYEKGKAEDYYMELVKRFDRGESFSRDSIHFPDSLKYRTLRLGRTVYGGGGIMPDVFVPQDTSFFTPFYGEVVRKGLLLDYVNEYVDNNRSRLSRQYPTVEKFLAKYAFPDGELERFAEYCSAKGVKPKEGDLEISGSEIRKYYTGLIIRSLFDFSEFIKYINQGDEVIEKAVEILGTKKG